MKYHKPRNVAFYRIDTKAPDNSTFGTTFGSIEEALDFLERIPLTYRAYFSIYLKSGEIFGRSFPALATPEPLERTVTTS